MQSIVSETIEQISCALVGKEEEIRMAICCLLAHGHLLIEDLPGMGKTTLAHALAKVTGLTYQRVQFTSDLLPGDILGFSVFNQQHSRFEFQPGPIFNQVLLADEINRATPKTQSALLEAMAENQVTVESATRPLPSPFFVIATQNPVTQAGTFSLPESQLDRFLMRISLGYPDEASEKALYQGLDSRSVIEHLPCTLDVDTLVVLQQQVRAVKASDAVLNYLLRLLNFTRHQPHFAWGISPRGGLALLGASKAWALIDGRDYLLPEDIQRVLPSVLGHRLQESADMENSGTSLVQFLMNHVDVIA
ncbi:MAG: ATPase AAA [Candidatus Entotheonella factor]|uniref:ATPase AAA n=1 Tax=Entotheonella factor TaxID=1429438 RepID=W4LT87_ENTF1|nr:MAG: ATPase AAA [Candidatus Entotheonella factor]